VHAASIVSKEDFVAMVQVERFFFDSTLLCQIETAHRMTCFCFGSKYGSVGFAAGDWRRDI